MAAGRGVSQKGSWETGVNCGKDQKEKGEDIVPGGLPRSHHLFLETEASGWCDSLCAVIYLPGHSPSLLFPIPPFLLFLLLTCVSGGLVLGPAWLSPKKTHKISVGCLLYARHSKSSIVFDPVQ